MSLFFFTVGTQFVAGKSDIYMKTSLPNVMVVGQIVAQSIKTMNRQNAQPPEDLL